MSTRRDGRSLGQMARDELGPFGGFAALIGTLDDHGHSDRGARPRRRECDEAQPVGHLLRCSPPSRSRCWSGCYMRNVRPGRVLEASIIGMVLLLIACGRRRLDRCRARRCARCSTTPAAAGVVRDRLRLARGHPAGVAVARAARLSVHVPEARRDSLLAIAIVRHASRDQDAGAHAVRRRQRARSSRARSFRSCSSPSPAARSPASMRWSPAARRRSCIGNETRCPPRSATAAWRWNRSSPSWR